MWLAVSLATIAASLALVLRAVRVFDGDRLAVLVILLIWGRFALTSVGDIATRPFAAGQSLLAIFTLLATLGAFFILPLERLRTAQIAPLAGFLGLVAVSSAINGQVIDAVNAITLWLLLIVLALLLLRAFERHGLQAVLLCLMAATALPMAMQLASLGFDQPMIGADGTKNYIGNFKHGAVFSIVTLTGLWLGLMYPWAKKPWLVVIFAAAMGALFLSNYRTLVIAAIPLALALLLRLSPPGDRAKRLFLPLLLGVVVLTTALPDLQTGRYAELGVALDSIDTLLQPPQYFSATEKDLLSARGYIWANYLHHYFDAEAAQVLVGFGPGAQVSTMGVHPHNEYIRVLYEYGAMGLCLWLGLFAVLIRRALVYVPQPLAGVIAAGHVSILVGSLGTSFFNRPEGMILFAILCSVTWYLGQSRQPRMRPAPPAAAGRTMT